MNATFHPLMAELLEQRPDIQSYFQKMFASRFPFESALEDIIADVLLRLAEKPPSHPLWTKDQQKQSAVGYIRMCITNEIYRHEQLVLSNQLCDLESVFHLLKYDQNAASQEDGSDVEMKEMKLSNCLDSYEKLFFSILQKEMHLHKYRGLPLALAAQHMNISVEEAKALITRIRRKLGVVSY